MTARPLANSIVPPADATTDPPRGPWAIRCACSQSRWGYSVGVSADDGLATSRAPGHRGAERWARFGLDQQILMVANEMNRARDLFSEADRDALRRTYERVLRLVNLTVQTRPQRGLRRELLRWRDLVAALYVSDRPDAPAHDDAFRCLLRFTPAASKQIPHLLA